LAGDKLLYQAERSNVFNQFNMVGGVYMTGQIGRLGLAASAVSIVASIYIYFMHDGGNADLGIFVGLWAPTLILFSQEIDKMMEQ